MSDLADRYARAITELGAPADVLGVSTGGSIAQQLAAEHPHVVRRLALVSTGWRLSPGTRALQREVARLLREGATRDAAALAAASAGPRATAPLLRAFGRLGAPWLLGDGRSVSDLRVTLEAEDAFDLTRCSGSVDAPTLVVGGGRDRFYPLASFEETARLIPRSRLVIRPRRGHVTVCGDRGAAAHLAGFFTAD